MKWISRFMYNQEANFDRSCFGDYCDYIKCPLIAKVNWRQPMLSWFILRYNGFVVLLY